MNLIKANIINFGVLSNISYDFTSGLNTILQDNGTGKSTLGVFIKAMFYGLTKQNIKDNALDERKLYSPWNKQVFGGSLVFEYNNKHYRIERTFGQTPKSDRLEVYDAFTNKISYDFPKTVSIGETIFSLSVSSYEKCSYYSSRSMDNKYQDDILSRLANLLEISNGSINYTMAIEKLKKKQNLYIGRNKGLIIDKKTELDTLMKELERIENEKINLLRLQDESNMLDKDILSLNIQKKVISGKILKSSTVLAYLEKIKQKENLENKIKDLKLKIVNLNEEDSLTITLLTNELKELEKTTNDYKSKIVLNSPLFIYKDLKNESINKLYLDITKYYELKNNNDEYIQKSNELNQLEDFFKGQYDKKKIENLSNVQVKKSSLSLFVVLIVLSITLLTLGIVLYKKNILFTIIFCIFSLISFFSGLIYYLYNLLNDSKNNAKTKKYLLMDFNLDDHLLSNFDEAVKTICEKEAIYLELVSQVDELKNNYLPKESNILNESIKKTFFTYHLQTQDYLESLEYLKKCYNDYQELEKANKDYNDKIIELNKIYNNKMERLKFIINHYKQYENIDFEDNCLDNSILLIDRIKTKNIYIRKELETLELELDNLLETIDMNVDSQYYKEFDIDKEKKTLVDIENQLIQLNKQHFEIEKKITSSLEIISTMDDYTSEVNKVKEELDKFNHEYDIIEKTIEYLNKAHTELSKKFISPMEKSINKYLKYIVQKDLTCDNELNIYVSEGGIKRDVDFYSSGYKDIIDLCMHLSLTENLYKKEKVTLILDDPFVNYDDNMLSKALDLLKYITSELGYQVIYFVCHTSRKE